MAPVARLIAHGGVGGALVEGLLVLTIVGVFLAVYVRERRSRRSREGEDV